MTRDPRRIPPADRRREAAAEAVERLVLVGVKLTVTPDGRGGWGITWDAPDAVDPRLAPALAVLGRVKRAAIDLLETIESFDVDVRQALMPASRYPHLRREAGHVVVHGVAGAGGTRMHRPPTPRR